MSDKQQRLLNRIRRAERQRRNLRESAERALGALAPSALGDRAKRNLGTRVKAADKAARAEINKHRVPLIAAAIGGLIFALREPIRNYGPRAVRRIKALANDLRDRADSEEESGAHESFEEASDEQAD